MDPSARVNTQNRPNGRDLQVTAPPHRFPLQFGGVNAAGGVLSVTGAAAGVLLRASHACFAF